MALMKFKQTSSRSVSFPGNTKSIYINDGKIYIGTDEYCECPDRLEIIINGNVNGNVIIENAPGDVKIAVSGSVNNVDTSNGDVTVDGDIKGYVKTTNGDVTAGGNIHGNVSTTNGDIVSKR